MNRSQTSLRLQENPEFQTSVTRFIIWSIAFGYMHGPELGDVYTTLFWVFFAVYVLVFASLFIVPVSILRRYFTIFIDIVGASIVIHGSGDAGDPLLLIYVWIYVGYGFRYGAHYLLAAAVVTMLGYSAVVYALHAWDDEPVQIALAVLILGLLPLYQYSLQKKLEQLLVSVPPGILEHCLIRTVPYVALLCPACDEPGCQACVASAEGTS